METGLRSTYLAKVDDVFVTIASVASIGDLVPTTCGVVSLDFWQDPSKGGRQERYASEEQS
jgi:membrane protein YqaA with SNARE-associated domain